MRTKIVMDIEIEHEGDSPPSLALAKAVSAWVEGENVYVQDDPRVFEVVGSALSKHDETHPDSANLTEPEPDPATEDAPEVESPKGDPETMPADVDD